jgi:hypothetical protein
MRRQLLFALLIAGCASAPDAVPEDYQGTWLRNEGADNAPSTLITLERTTYIESGVRLPLSDFRREGGAVLASATHEVKVDTAGFDLGWRVEHGFRWTIEGDSLIEIHDVRAIFPDQADEPLETQIRNAYSRPE